MIQNDSENLRDIIGNVLLSTFQIIFPIIKTSNPQTRCGHAKLILRENFVKEREGALYGEWKFSDAGATEQSQVFWSDQFIVGFCEVESIGMDELTAPSVLYFYSSFIFTCFFNLLFSKEECTGFDSTDDGNIGCELIYLKLINNNVGLSNQDRDVEYRSFTTSPTMSPSQTQNR
ncbi:hypothetical protein YC2023_099099 [Brassica napus]